MEANGGFREPQDHRDLPVGLAPFTVENGDTINVETDVTNGSFDVLVDDDMFVGLDPLGDMDSTPAGGVLTHSSLINGTIAFTGGGGGCCFSIIYGAPGNMPFNVASFDSTAEISGVTGGFDIQTVRLSFQSSNSAVVPEPATWALMIAGFGSAGAMFRRRRRADTYAAA